MSLAIIGLLRTVLHQPLAVCNQHNLMGEGVYLFLVILFTFARCQSVSSRSENIFDMPKGESTTIIMIIINENDVESVVKCNFREFYNLGQLKIWFETRSLFLFLFLPKMKIVGTHVVRALHFHFFAQNNKSRDDATLDAVNFLFFVYCIPRLIPFKINFNYTKIFFSFLTQLITQLNWRPNWNIEIEIKYEIADGVDLWVADGKIGLINCIE